MSNTRVGLTQKTATLLSKSGLLLSSDCQRQHRMHQDQPLCTKLCKNLWRVERRQLTYFRPHRIVSQIRNPWLKRDRFFRSRIIAIFCSVQLRAFLRSMPFQKYTKRKCTELKRTGRERSAAEHIQWKKDHEKSDLCTWTPGFVFQLNFCFLSALKVIPKQQWDFHSTLCTNEIFSCCPCTKVSFSGSIMRISKHVNFIHVQTISVFFFFFFFPTSDLTQGPSTCRAHKPTNVHTSGFENCRLAPKPRHTS